VLSWFIYRRRGSFDPDLFTRYSENASAEGALECDSASYRHSVEFQGGSVAAALQGASPMVIGKTDTDAL